MLGELAVDLRLDPRAGMAVSTVTDGAGSPPTWREGDGGRR